VRQVKLSLLALVLVSAVVGCGSGKVNTKELTPEQIAAQEATLKEVSATEAERQKKAPKTRTAEQEVNDSERARPKH
jgi:outer membrane lipoprotein-sorting protein